MEKGWETVFGDMDCVKYQKRIPLMGVSKYSIDRLKKWQDENSYKSSRGCGHGFCGCGCLTGTAYELLLSENTAILEKTCYFNY